ncbi:odorant receptor 4-like isoform X1 [Temnothorax longispinosus]|uniref:odorant receptor 4-like isoform X1 n=1 Tax=Temnothorax longispinosus TaxID=300112 RepID=UPI003A98FB32
MKQIPTSTINRSIEIPLRIFGIWPGLPYISFCRLFWTITVVAVQSFQYRYLITHFYTVDFSDLMDGLSATLGYSQFFSKLIIFWLKQRTFVKILAMMAMDWKKISSDDFSTRVTISKAILSHNFTNFVFGTYSIAITLYCASIFMSNLEATDISTRPLILKMDFPFNSDTRFVYGLVLVIQFFCTVLYGSAAVMLNALLIVLVLHLAGQLEILDKWLSDIISKDNEYRLSVKTIRKIIEKHQNIIIFSKNIKNLYSDIALILFMSDTLIICSIDFLLVRSIGNPDSATILMKFVGFYAAVTSEVFMFCFAGEYLSAKSRAIGDAAYNSQWYQCRFQDSRIILFLIMRSQNQLTITIGKFMDLSFERFLNIMKASASYVSVMLAMY